MLDALDQEERLRLMRFVCSFAWADLEVGPQERELVASLVERLGLNDSERAQVEEWLQVPPAADDLDPADIPREHRQLFLDVAKTIVMSDGSIADVEVENLLLLEQLLR